MVQVWLHVHSFIFSCPCASCCVVGEEGSYPITFCPCWLGAPQTNFAQGVFGHHVTATGTHGEKWCTCTAPNSGRTCSELPTKHPHPDDSASLHGSSPLSLCAIVLPSAKSRLRRCPHRIRHSSLGSSTEWSLLPKCVPETPKTICKHFLTPTELRWHSPRATSVSSGDVWNRFRNVS